MNPSLVRKAFYPLHERLLARPTFAYLAELEASQHLPRAEIERLQEAKLATLLCIALRHCPWHEKRIQAAGIAPSDGQVSLEQLRRLPTMTKADAQSHGDQMRWSGAPGGAQRYNTGGSSGTPLIFHFGRLRQASDAAGRMRARRWWGVEVGEREVYLWGAPAELNKTDHIKTLRDRLFNQLVLNAFAMSPSAMDSYIDAIRRFRPRCVYGYASSLALLAAHVRARGRSLQMPELRVVCVTGEPLYPRQRRLMETIYGVPVANEFGSRDIGFTAHESPDGQMLLMSESVILEVLDGRGNPVAPGELGEAVMTGLCSEAQPFIRYRSGDMVRLSHAPCKSGRGLHAIDEVVGRQTDFVVRSDGTIMHALALIYVLRTIRGVGEFKIVQHEMRRLEIQVVPNSDWDENAAAEIVAGVHARLGDDVQVEVVQMSAIAPERSGKYRYVVSHVPLPEGLSLSD